MTPITHVEPIRKIWMTHDDLVTYLKQIEEDPEFMPWSSVEAAGKHLVATFHVPWVEAMTAAVMANVTVDIFREAEETDDAHDEFMQGEELRRGM